MNFDEQQEENVLILRACIRILITRSKHDDEKKILHIYWYEQLNKLILNYVTDFCLQTKKKFLF